MLFVSADSLENDKIIKYFGSTNCKTMWFTGKTHTDLVFCETLDNIHPDKS